jgi:hypothetical protein
MSCRLYSVTAADKGGKKEGDKTEELAKCGHKTGESEGRVGLTAWLGRGRDRGAGQLSACSTGGAPRQPTHVG